MNADARLAADHAAVLDALPADEVAPGERRAALAAVTERGLPAPREENWRYTNLRPLASLRFAPRLALDAAALERAAALLPAPIPGFERVVLVDGLYAASLSTPPGESAGVALAVRRGLGLRADPATGDLRLASLAAAFAPEALAIEAGADATRQLEVICVATAPGETTASYPALTIDVAARGRLKLIERQLGVDEPATFANAAIEVRLGAAAQLHHVRLQQAGRQAVHFETLRATLEADADYQLDTIALGALSARTTVHARLAGRGARIAYGRSVAIDDTQVNDACVTIEHAAPATVTEQDYRGIAAGRARVGFNGRVVMRDNAAGSASRQSLRSLLAGPGTEADVRPQLEIYTDDVKATHGATAGKLDEQMLFYLLSRGIEPRTAKSLLKWAHLTELVARVASPELRAQVERAFAARFTGDDAEVARELT